MPSTRRLEDKVAIVTGASRGIGREIAVLFAKEGAKLVLTARNQELLTSLAAEIVQNGGEEPLIFTLDVKDAAKVGNLRTKLLTNIVELIYSSTMPASHGMVYLSD